MARMTISLTVILLEATGDMQYVLPLMLCLMTARCVGNVFNDGLYDIHVKLAKMPFLEEDLPEEITHQHLTAAHIMCKDHRRLRPVQTVGDVCDALAAAPGQQAFAVADDDGFFVGSVSRKVVCVVLADGAFGSADDAGAPTLAWARLERHYPSHPDVPQLKLSSGDRERLLDLRPYVDRGAHTVRHSASVERTYKLFRTMGLHHVSVVDAHSRLLGVVRREDLTEEALHRSTHGLEPTGDYAGAARPAAGVEMPELEV